MEYVFLLLNILAIIICGFFLNIDINIYEKLLIIISIIFQIIVILCILFKINSIIKHIYKIFVITIVLGILIIKNYYLNFFILILLFITLLTRYYFNRCLFFYKENNYIKDIRGDLCFFILFAIYLIKILYIN